MAPSVEFGAETRMDLAALIIPLADRNLVVPNEAVAEVVPWQALTREGELPAWHLGVCDWRGVRLPVVSFEAIDGGRPAAAREGACLVVLNTLTGNSEPGFCGLLSQRFPRPLQLSDADLKPVDEAPGTAELARARIGREPASIPNLEFVEAALRPLSG